MSKSGMLLATIVLTLVTRAATAQTPVVVLKPGTPIAVPGSAAHFDYMTVDPDEHRVFASEPGANALVVVDTKKNTLQQIILGTEVNGVAVDNVDGKFFTAGGGGKVFDFDRKTLKQNNEIDLGAPADSILFVAQNDTLYIDNDDGTKIWALNGKTDQIVATITIAGAPEYMAFDASTHHLYQNIKTLDSIQQIDTTTNTVTARWPTLPALKPHGLVFDPLSKKLFSAGKNDTLVEIDPAVGSVVGVTKLASPTDQIAFDPKLRRIYAPGTGAITVVTVAADGTPAELGWVETPKGAHTLAVDPNTGSVWVSYPNDANTASYIQPFTPVE